MFWQDGLLLCSMMGFGPFGSKFGKKLLVEKIWAQPVEGQNLVFLPCSLGPCTSRLIVRFSMGWNRLQFIDHRTHMVEFNLTWFQMLWSQIIANIPYMDPVGMVQWKGTLVVWIITVVNPWHKNFQLSWCFHFPHRGCQWHKLFGGISVLVCGHLLGCPRNLVNG